MRSKPRVQTCTARAFTKIVATWIAVAIATLTLNTATADARRVADALPAPCFTCLAEEYANCGENEHVDVELADYLTGEKHSFCTYWDGDYGICGEHPWCNSEAVDLATELEGLLNTGQLGQFANVVQSRSTIHVNKERKAIQIEGCAGTLVAHIPLTDAAFVKLTP